MNITNAPSGTIRSALRYPDFRWLLSALAVSQIGDWLYNLALVVLVYDRTHSAPWAGVTTAARVVPVVVLVRRPCIAASHGGRGTRSLESAAKQPRMTTGGRHDEFPREHRVG